MGEKEKQIARTIVDALAGLPEEKKQFFLGYAEGVAAMADQMKDRKAGRRRKRINMEYIASLSYGKDSIAMLEVISKYQMPLHRIVHVEIMATRDIPGDLPEVVQWKQLADEIIYQRYGIRVEHIHSGKTFEELFYRIPKRRSFNAEKQGTIRGFPSLQCKWCSKELKVDVMKRILRNCVQYIGIAANETDRHSQLTDMVSVPRQMPSSFH